MATENISSKNSMNPKEMAFQTFCKQILKSQIFKGFYDERRYVDAVKDYRDIIVLNESETDVKALLLLILQKTMDFYRNPNLWIGITSKKPENNATTNIIIWTELEQLAFGHYWFSIKSVRFRDNEVFIKLKPVRLVESVNEGQNVNPLKNDTYNDVNVVDFYNLIVSWGDSIKKTFFTFLNEGITKDNIKGTLKFLSLICLSLMTASLHGIRFIGIFTIHFLIEFRRFISVSTPIFLRLIDLLTKAIGGFYILLAMMWRDTIGGILGKRNDSRRPLNAITDNAQNYQRLRYNQSNYTSNVGRYKKRL